MISKCPLKLKNIIKDIIDNKNKKYIFIMNIIEELSEWQKSEIIYTCNRKCFNDIDNPNLDNLEKICLSRCTFKFIDALFFSNKVIDSLEDKFEKESN